jgi:hypothetical protein
MKPSTSTLALGLALSLAAPCQSALASDPEEQLLLARANYWRGQHCLDQTAATLQKILALNPRQADALLELGMLAAAQHNAGEAQGYFDRLGQIARDDPHAAQLLKASEAARAGNPASAQPAPVVPVLVIAAAAVAAPREARAQAAAPPAAAANAAAHAEAPAPAPLQLAAVSADSDDLAPARPATSGRAPTYTAGSRADRAAPGRQLASLSVETSDIEITASAAPATVPSAGSTDAEGKKPVQVAQVELMPPPPIGGYVRPVNVPEYSPDDTLEMQLDRSVALLEAQTNPSLVAGIGLRVHGGDSGTSKLTEVGVPVEATFSPWLTGTARFAVVPVYLNSGSISQSNLAQFGANPILAAAGSPLASAGYQSAFGVGLLGSYAYNDFSAQLGSTPLGFAVTNVIGNIAYTPKFLGNTLSLRIEGLRQPVTDTLLSYAGTHASLGAANALTNGAFGTNSTWGGVVRTGGHVAVFYDDGYAGAYGGAGLASVTGTNVADNSEVDALAGAYFRPWKTDNWAIRVGVALFYIGFDKNLDGFTFGQGGYFSPQNFESLTFPIEYTGHSGNWSYLAGGAIGVQHFNSDSSPIFPNNPAAQTALVNLGTVPTTFSGSGSTGPGFNFRGQIEYAIDHTLSVGASANVDNAKSYTEGIAKIYLRKTFDWLGSDPASVVSRDQPLSHM